MDPFLACSMRDNSQRNAHFLAQLHPAIRRDQLRLRSQRPGLPPNRVEHAHPQHLDRLVSPRAGANPCPRHLVDRATESSSFPVEVEMDDADGHDAGVFAGESAGGLVVGAVFVSADEGVGGDG